MECIARINIDHRSALAPYCSLGKSRETRSSEYEAECVIVVAYLEKIHLYTTKMLYLLCRERNSRNWCLWYLIELPPYVNIDIT